MTRGKNGEKNEIKDEPNREIKIKGGPNRPLCVLGVYQLDRCCGVLFYSELFQTTSRRCIKSNVLPLMLYLSYNHCMYKVYYVLIVFAGSNFSKIYKFLKSGMFLACW